MFRKQLEVNVLDDSGVVAGATVVIKNNSGSVIQTKSVKFIFSSNSKLVGLKLKLPPLDIVTIVKLCKLGSIRLRLQLC